MKKKSVISGRPKITDQSQDHCVDDTFCPKITVWTVARPLKEVAAYMILFG